jgi:hypothetical protein
LIFRNGNMTPPSVVYPRLVSCRSVPAADLRGSRKAILSLSFA